MQAARCGGDRGRHPLRLDRSPSLCAALSLSHLRVLCRCVFVADCSFASKREPDPFEWYQEFGALKHILSRYLTKQTAALVVGCGTSLLSEELHKAECKSVLSIDFSQTCIDVCKKKYANQQGMQCPEQEHTASERAHSTAASEVKAAGAARLAFLWHSTLTPFSRFCAHCACRFCLRACACAHAVGHMDMRKLDFGPERFDLVVDKGSLDSLLCGDDAEVSAARAVAEIARVLVSGGVFVMVSHAGPEHREALLKVPSDGFIHYQYATVTKPRVDDSSSSAAEAKDDDVHYVYVAIKGKKK